MGVEGHIKYLFFIEEVFGQNSESIDDWSTADIQHKLKTYDTVVRYATYYSPWMSTVNKLYVLTFFLSLYIKLCTPVRKLH